MAKKKKAVTDAEDTLIEKADPAEGVSAETADDLADAPTDSPDAAVEVEEATSDADAAEPEDAVEADATPDASSTGKRSRSTAPKKSRRTEDDDEDEAESATTKKSTDKSDGESKSAKKSTGPKARNTKGKKKQKKVAGPGSRRWVVPLFLVLLLLGVVWLVVFYIGSVTGFIFDVPVMGRLGNWNILIGMGLMGASFFTMTLWK